MRSCVEIGQPAFIREGNGVPWLAIGVMTLFGAILAYKTITPRTRRSRKYDAGAVSEDWIQQQRGRSEDAHR